jgi:DNA-binding XRE family transcriptional regulator
MSQERFVLAEWTREIRSQRCGEIKAASKSLRSAMRIADQPSVEAKIGLEVRCLRLAKGMTLAELAATAMISPGMLSKLETGNISPSLKTLSAIAKCLDVPLARLFVKT